MACLVMGINVCWSVGMDDNDDDDDDGRAKS